MAEDRHLWRLGMETAPSCIDPNNKNVISAKTDFKKVLKVYTDR